MTPDPISNDDAASAQQELIARLTADLADARLASARLEDALASERRALSADLHDSVAQTLAFVKMRMPLLHAAIAEHDAQAALRYCDDVRSAVTSAHTNLRKVLSEFRVPVDPQGLGSALRSAILVFTERAQVALDFDDQALGVRLSALQETQVFHIVQESLSNIAKHAAARQAWLRIEAAGSRVDVVVEDDGSGPSGRAEAANTGHFGVDIMRQRAACLGGSIDIGPRSGGGTRVHLSFPLIDAAAGAA